MEEVVPIMQDHLLKSSLSSLQWSTCALANGGVVACILQCKGASLMRLWTDTERVSRNILTSQEEEEDVDAEGEEEAPAFSFFGGRGQQSLATQAERSFKAQQPGPKRGTRQTRQQPAK